MMNLPTLAPAPSQKATRIGLVYWIFSTLLLGTVIQVVAILLGIQLSLVGLNMIYYGCNFAAALLIFRKFLAANWRTMLDRLFPTVYYAILAYFGCQLLTGIVAIVILRLDPNFFNVNDESIHAMITAEPALMVVGTVLLAPVAEEIFYRGMVFRKLFDKNAFLGYCVSMLLFAAIHMIGYIGTYPPLQLLLGCLQYLPAGYCLCWCYRQTGNIFSPILMHMIFNATSIYNFVR